MYAINSKIFFVADFFLGGEGSHLIFVLIHFPLTDVFCLLGVILESSCIRVNMVCTACTVYIHFCMVYVHLYAVCLFISNAIKI